PALLQDVLLVLRNSSTRTSNKNQPTPVLFRNHFHVFYCCPVVQCLIVLNCLVRVFQGVNELPPTGELDEATLGVMRQPRCGFLSFSGRWRRKRLTYRIHNYTPDMVRSEVRKALRSAFKYWSDAADLTFTEIDFGRADIKISFHKKDGFCPVPFDGRGLFPFQIHSLFPTQINQKLVFIKVGIKQSSISVNEYFKNVLVIFKEKGHRTKF
uniref:Peptidase metallopeptidase domain-containing protein n=1 Tax=Xiphophorus couchianus TaxID=32473 RepID=A0A3B5MMU0_9TELE